MVKLKSIIDLNLIAIFCLAAFGYLAYNSLNNKMEKVSSMWKTANNVVTKNQSKVIKIREAFSDEQDQLTVFIDNMPDNERKQWLTDYSQKIQKILYTPPSGLEKQGGL